MADTDATADQGAEERVARAIKGAIVSRGKESGAFIETEDADTYMMYDGEIEVLELSRAAIAALPLQASCVGLMEELEQAHTEAADPFVLDERVTDIVMRYAALKAAQEKPSAD